MSILERRPDAGWLAFVPGSAVAVALHAAFNEKNIGTAGLSVLRPLLQARGKDLWQLVLLESTRAGA